MHEKSRHIDVLGTIVPISPIGGAKFNLKQAKKYCINGHRPICHPFSAIDRFDTAKCIHVMYPKQKIGSWLDNEPPRDLRQCRALIAIAPVVSENDAIQPREREDGGY